jgi:hypothetical protein
MTTTNNPFALSAILIGVTLVLAAQAAAYEQNEAVEPALQRYVGTYQYVGGDEDIEALDSAIDGVVSQMNFFIRGIARRRLRKPNLPSKEVIISLENGQIRIDRPGQPEVSAPADGKPITWRHPDDGDVFEVRHGIDDQGVLYQRFKGERSVSRNDFVLGDEGRRLNIVTEITADRLPAPLRFEMSYRRVSSSDH